MNNFLKAGVGRTDITPELGTRLMGYPIEDRVAKSIHDPLHATSLILESRGLKVAIISLDLVLADDELVAAIRRDVHARTGIAPDNVTICAIQTHTGPATQTCWGWGDKDTAYIAASLTKIIDSVVEADAKLEPVRLGIGTTHSKVGVNRREILPDHSVGLGVNPWGPYDPTMTVLRFEGERSPVAIIVHYGAHPTAMGHASVVSRDWPGVMIDRVEALTSTPTLFINGAVGDVGPRVNTGKTVGDGPAAASEVGYRAASDAMRALRSIKELRDVCLDTLTEDILLHYRPLTDLEEARQKMTAAEPGKDQWGEPMCEYLHWRAVVEAHSRPIVTGKSFRQTTTRLGPVVLVPFPGEPFAEIVLRVRHASPFEHTLCASTTNGSNGYFVTRESLHRGGYEVWVARAFGAYLLAENIDDVLVESNLKLLCRLAGVDTTSN